jgi:hypothetical protein
MSDNLDENKTNLCEPDRKKKKEWLKKHCSKSEDSQ